MSKSIAFGMAATMLFAMLLSGCSDGSGPTPAPTPAPTAAPTNTPRPVPTPPPTAAPTNTPAPAPMSAPTAAPTIIPTPESTPPPTVTPTNTPTPEPTPARAATPTNTPTPEPTATPAGAPSPTPTATERPAPVLHIDSGAKWREVFDSLSDSEQACIRDALKDDLESVLGETVLADGDEIVSFVSCLEPAKAQSIFLSLQITLLEEELGRDLSEEESTCLQELVAGIDVAAYTALAEDSNQQAEVAGGLLSCVPDLFIVAILAEFGFDQPDDLSEEESTCLQELVAGIDVAVFAAVYEDSDQYEELTISMLSCVPDLFIVAILAEFGFGQPDLSEEELACIKELLADTDLAEIVAASLPDASPESADQLELFGIGVLGCLADLLLPDSGEPAAGPPPPDDSLLWQFSTGSPGEVVIVSPIVANGMVYAGSYEGFVYAVDARTGELEWVAWTEGPLSPPPQVAGGVVLVDYLGALDATTGDLLWGDESVQIGSISAALLSDGTVYVPAGERDDFNVRGIDALSGEQLWETDVPRSTDLPLLFPLTALGSNVYVSDEFQLHALESATGSLVWSFDAGDIFQGPPSASNGVVYLRSYTAAYALDESTGEELWRYEVDYGGLSDRPPYIVDGVWPIVGLGVLRALDAATGQPLWSFEEDYVFHVSGVGNGMVFVAGALGFYALDAETGDEMWRLGADRELGEVTVVDGVLYANSLSGYLHMLDASTGGPIWSVDIGYHLGGVDDPYLVSGGVVYVGYQLDDSGIYAFTAPLQLQPR